VSINVETIRDGGAGMNFIGDAREEEEFYSSHE